VGASAAQDEDRLDAILGSHLGAVHDCRLATDRDFLMSMAATERLVLLASRGEKEQHRAQQPQDACQKAAYRLVPLAS
jgi:hypothetical protein